MADYKKGLGIRIISCREKINLSRSELAEAIGISTSYLGLIERGERGISVQHLMQIAELFNVSINYLLLGEEKSFDRDDAFLSFMSQFCADKRELLTKIGLLLINNPDSENQLEAVRNIIDYYFEYKIKIAGSKT